MAEKTRAALKAQMATGTVLNAAKLEDLVDSSYNKTDDDLLGETETTAYRGDRGKTAYDHSQATHAPSNAQKNSDITKVEIEAKLTGAVTSHSHATLATGRTIAMTGDVAYTSGAFNGSANVTGAATLANSGATAGTYKSVTVDAKGRVTGGSNPNSLGGYGITDAYSKTEIDGQKTPQVISYSATPTHNFATKANAIITLTGNVTNYTLQNVPEGGSGIVEVRQNATGGYGIAAISHAGLTIVYQTGQIPTAANINNGANETTLIGYYRSGDNLQISFPTKETGAVTLPPQTISFSSTPVQDVDDGKDAVITLTGAVTEYTLQNVSDGDEGRIEVTQNGTGGFNLTRITQSGLTTWYKDGKEPDGTNMNVAANGKTIIFYKRFGNTLAVDVQKYEEGAPEPVSGLIHLWLNDEGSGGTVTDTVGTNNGTDVGTVTHGTTPDCRIYNGTDAGSSFALPSSVFDVGMTKDFTVSVRFSLEATSNTKPIFMAVVDSDSYLYLTVGDVDNTIQAQMKYGSGNNIAKRTSAVDNSTFYHAVIVHTASTHDFKFYIDTVEVLNTSTAYFAGGVGTNMRVAYADLASVFTNMKCGKIQILNKACSPTEVAAL